MKNAKSKFEELKKEVSFDNGYFKDCIEYRHQDGTTCKFNNATFKDLGEGGVAIFTEHSGYMMLFLDDLEWIRKVSYDCLYYSNDECKLGSWEDWEDDDEGESDA